MSYRSALLGSIIVPDMANPRPEDVDISFMEYRMQTIVRFSGHPAALNLSEHQLLCSLLAISAGFDGAVRQWASLHDHHEYATGDLTTPLQRSIRAADLNEVQRRWDAAICGALGVPEPDDAIRDEVARIDQLALCLEWRFALGRDVSELGLPWEVTSYAKVMTRDLFDKAVTKVRQEEMKFGHDMLAMG